MLNPIIKGYNENLTDGYLAFRIIESVLLIVITLSSLLLITLSQEYNTAVNSDIDTLKTVGAIRLLYEWIGLK